MNRPLLRFGSLLLLVLLLLSACSSTAQETPTPAPTTVTIQVDVTPAAHPAAAALNACAEAFPNIDVQIRERYASQSDAGLLIRLGAPEGSPEPEAGFLAQIATEELRVVLNPDNPASSLTNADIFALFSGQITDWGQLVQATPSDQQDDAETPVDVWVPLTADESRLAFESQIMAGLPVVSDAGLAPDPTAMLEAISADPYAIGYLPSAWEAGDLQTIQLGIRLPVLVQADAAPTGPTADLVACMQGAIGQLALLSLYP